MKTSTIFYSLLIITMLFGCGGGGGSGESAGNPDPEPFEEARIISDEYYEQQWSINFDEEFYHRNGISPQAHITAGDYLRRYDGSGVKIAIIDDALDLDHEDLQGAVHSTYDISTKTGDVGHTSWNQLHGTAISGLIAARENTFGIKGIASKSQLIFLKYRQNMSDSETIELFDKAAELGADIINCSWGTYFVSQAVKEKIQDLARNGRDGRGIPIVFAVGNSNRDVGAFDESAIPEVIAVGASDEENLRAAYSNYGKQLDLLAPGGDILGITTLDLTGSDGYATFDENYLLYDEQLPFKGSSAAAPIVSGFIAILLEINPGLTRNEIVEILHESCDKIGTLSYEDGRNDFYGYGKLNVSAAIQLALQK